ncbi:hypothetical protein HYP84_gp023 [Shigella phage MK-13]|uniref:Uncharacterized protein n=1 Tax=Shigella phage MK-13 TaxID=2530042 RepID=A0A513QBC9_9CAUD|nr:hypothetical protein HYP84_gp023 [Shigella phage MK-13]QBJ04256.1 hypothetical protein MK13_00023 [Shigella phage MK-13]
MKFIETVMSVVMTVGALFGIALLFLWFFYIGVRYLEHKKRRTKKGRPKNVDIIISQARSRTRQ